jgi:hypothetical protein
LNKLRLLWREEQGPGHGLPDLLALPLWLHDS